MRKGEFRVAVCTSCRRKIWPPFQICSACFSKTKLKKIERYGTIIEYSTTHIEGIQGLFGVVDIDGIKLIGSISCQTLYHGMKVKLTDCGIRKDGLVYYHFEAAG